MGMQLLALLGVLALLVCNAAACLASRLTRGLAFAATAVFSTVTKITSFDGLNMFHSFTFHIKNCIFSLSQCTFDVNHIFAMIVPRSSNLVFCLWDMKKIFLLFLHMNSNSCKNEILADARMKSANADEIFGFASDEIKSTHSPSRRISPNEVGFHRRRRFHPPARVDLVENDKFLSKLVVFWWT